MKQRFVFAVEKACPKAKAQFLDNKIVGQRPRGTTIAAFFILFVFVSSATESHVAFPQFVQQQFKLPVTVKHCGEIPDRIQVTNSKL